MASTTDLGKWMLTNGGEYNPETAYEQLTMVMYENSTYITLKTVQGITPTDDHINYQLMAKGFNPTALESVQAEDTSGVLGEVGGTVSAQDLINWVVDQAATKLLKISDLVSVQTNDATKGVSAALAYAMGQKLDQLNSNLISVKMFEIEVTTKSTKDPASGLYIGTCKLIDSPSYPKGENILAVIPYGARTKLDAGRSAMVAYRTSDTFISVNSPNQPNEVFIVNVAVFYSFSNS